MPLADSYDIGDTVREGNHSGSTDRQAFKNSAGVDTDPTAVTLRVEEPDGTVTTYSWPTGTPSLTKEVTGRFYVDLTFDQAGIHSFELKGTGAVATVDQWSDFVRSNLVG